MEHETLILRALQFLVDVERTRLDLRVGPREEQWPLREEAKELAGKLRDMLAKEEGITQ